MEFQEPQTSDPDPIQTYNAFVAETRRAREEYEGLLAKSSSELHIVRVVREIGALPSEASRQYARSLAKALTAHGINGVEGFSPSTGTATTTYKELAQVTALTSLFKQDPYSRTEIPRECLMALLRAMAVNCPSEDAMLGEVGMSLLLEYNNWYKEPPEPRVRREWRELVELSLRRVLHDRKEAIYSGISAGGLSGAGEFLLAYLSTIDAPSGRNVQDLIQLSAQRNKQIAQLRMPADYVERMKNMEESLAERGREGYRVLDTALLETKSAEKALKEYCIAVNHRDQAAQNALVSFDDGVTLQPLLGGRAGTLSVDYVMLGFPGTSIVARFVVTDGLVKRVVPVQLSATRVDGKWRITRVGEP